MTPKIIFLRFGYMYSAKILICRPGGVHRGTVCTCFPAPRMAPSPSQSCVDLQARLDSWPWAKETSSKPTPIYTFICYPLASLDNLVWAVFSKTFGM